jgi:hypothetical protein
LFTPFIPSLALWSHLILLLFFIIYVVRCNLFDNCSIILSLGLSLKVLGLRQVAVVLAPETVEEAARDRVQPFRGQRRREQQ